MEGRRFKVKGVRRRAKGERYRVEGGRLKAQGEETKSLALRLMPCAMNYILKSLIENSNPIAEIPNPKSKSSVLCFLTPDT